jgi:hypothetical protein
MGAFDPNTFLDMQFTEANSTQSIPVPVGEYLAITEEPIIRNWTSKDGSKSGIALDVPLAIDDAKVRAELGREKVSVRFGIMLDLNDSGGIDTGKGRNVQLGRLREALDLNQPGKPFSFRMLAGRPVKVSIKHRVDGDMIYADVAGVARPA